MRRAWLLISFLPLAGCLPLTEDRNTLVSGNPFHQPGGLGPITQANYAPGAKEAIYRVDQAGQKLVEANPQLGFKPSFATIGSPRLEMFHVDVASREEPKGDAVAKGAPIIYITDGIVNRCASDNELTAILSYELGRILSGREADRRGGAVEEEKMPPIQVPIGNASHSPIGPDLTALAELGKFEKRHPRSRKLVPPSDPRKIATTLLDKAGFSAATLESVEPILAEADHNAALERQIKTGMLPTWRTE